MNISSIFNYGYHDSTISRIEIINDYIYMHFYDGLYLIDEKCFEKEKSGPMVLKIKLNNTVVEDVSFLISIVSYNRKKKYIDLNAFNNDALKNNVNISNVYYSVLNSELLIVAASYKRDYYITLEECVDIEFISMV